MWWASRDGALYLTRTLRVPEGKVWGGVLLSLHGHTTPGPSVYREPPMLRVTAKWAATGTRYYGTVLQVLATTACTGWLQ